MDVNVTGAYVYAEIPIFGGIPITQTTVSLLLVTLLLCTAFILLGRNLKKRPDGKQVLLEKGVLMLHNLVVSAMGEHNAKFLPLIGTIFLSSICGSLIGMTGFLRSTTADLSVPLVWAILVTLIIWYNNIKNQGLFGWLKGFTEPIVLMTPMNLLGEIAQPMSMAFRHFGNVAGGGVITSILYTGLTLASTAAMKLIATNGLWISLALIGACVLLAFLQKKLKKLTKLMVLAIAFFSGLLGVFGLVEHFGILSDVPILMFGIPAVLSLYFDLFSGFVQALVFSLLSMVYIAGACPPPQEEPEMSNL
jgi:F-type H+-transporting ATPase subunit a